MSVYTTEYVGIFLKRPAEVLDYTINWDDGWLASGDSISTSTWSVDTGITQNSESETTTTTTVTLSGGSLGDWYEAENTVATAQGRTGVRTILIQMTG